LAKSLVTEYGIKENDLKDAVAAFKSKPDKTPCSVSLAAL
jgi:hypothetical protein